MTKKQRIERIFAALVIVILVIVLIAVFTRNKDGEEDADVLSPLQQIDRRSLEPTSVDARANLAGPEVIATSFVERFSSYSTDNNFQNVIDAKALATASMDLRLDQLTETNSVSLSFYGVSTYVITQDVIVEDNNGITFVMTTQREEAFDTPANTSTRYQDITVRVIRENGEWLVDDFIWGA
ncbi:MAG: hypothetical protein O3B64_03735 [bacterium]|nr:hypothetical protein [bacterium]